METTYSLTLDEDELYRVRQGLFAKVADYNRDFAKGNESAGRIAAKYMTLIDKTNDLVPRTRRARAPND